jgi:hypothetical protein
MKRRLTIRIRILIIILLITIMGFGSKLYSGVCSDWFNNSLAGLFYETFWCLVVFFINPRHKAIKIALWVLVFTSALEFLQLWHPPFLQIIRSTFIGAALIGTSFNWSDFPYYIAGCIAGFILMKYLFSNGAD